MTKLINLLKLCAAMLSVYLAFPTDNSIPADLINGYTDQLSYYPGERQTVFLSNKVKHRKVVFRLYDIMGNIVDSAISEANPQEPRSDSSWEKGFGYSPVFSYNIGTLGSGMYLWENRVPFTVKSRDARSCMVVIFPAASLHAISNEGGKSLYAYNSTDKVPADIVSFHRPLLPDQYSKSFLPWIKDHLEEKYQVVYRTDADLEDYEEIRGARMLIIYGYSEFWTKEMRLNLDRFVHEGGNILIASSGMMSNRSRINTERTQMAFFHNPDLDPLKGTDASTLSWNNWRTGNYNYASAGGTYELGGYPALAEKKSGYTIWSSQNPILEGTRLKYKDRLELSSSLYTGLPLTGYSEDGIPQIDNGLLLFHQYEIIGSERCSFEGKVNSGIFIVFQRTESSGIGINFGTGDWCGPNNIKDPAVSRITLNAVSLLMNNKKAFSPKTSGAL